MVKLLCVGLFVMLPLEVAHAMKLCWQNPSENIDGTPLTDLESIIVYKDGQQLATWAADAAGSEQCMTFRLAEGTYDFFLTAVDSEGNQSSPSNTVRKTESRLGGPTGGEVLEGPTGGRVITGDQDG